MAEVIVLYGTGAMFESEWRHCQEDPGYFEKTYPKEFYEYQSHLLQQVMAEARRQRREAERAAEEASRQQIIEEVCRQKGVRDVDSLCYGDLPWEIF